MVTNQFVYDNGEVVDSYPCDIDPVTGETESNGGVEHIVQYKDKFYAVITSWDGDVVYDGNRKAKTRKLQDIDV